MNVRRTEASSCVLAHAMFFLSKLGYLGEALRRSSLSLHSLLFSDGFCMESASLEKVNHVRLYIIRDSIMCWKNIWNETLTSWTNPEEKYTNGKVIEHLLAREHNGALLMTEDFPWGQNGLLISQGDRMGFEGIGRSYKANLSDSKYFPKGEWMDQPKWLTRDAYWVAMPALGKKLISLQEL